MNLIHFCLKRLVGTSVGILRTRFVHWTTPLTSSLPLGTLVDLARSKAELLAEHALLRQQLREATPFGQAPKYLICDHESKFGPCFARVATTSAIEILKTPVQAPRANAICERFLRSVRQACLDQLLILHGRQLQRVLNAYVAYFNQARPHQGIKRQIPELPVLSDPGITSMRR